MTMFDYDEESRNAVITLDKYDLSKYLEGCVKGHITDSWEVREALMLFCNDEIEKAIEDLSIDEFIEYLTSRYNVSWSDEIRYHIHVKGNDVSKNVLKRGLIFMSKSVLVIDMPDRCYVRVIYDSVHEVKPDCCPLREVPEKFVMNIPHDKDYDGEYEHGRNACIDEILEGEY